MKTARAVKTMKIDQAANLVARVEGMALAMVLIFTALLMILGVAVLGFAANERLIAGYHSSDIRLFYIVEGGLETGIAVLREDFYYPGELTGSIEEGVFTVFFSDEYEHYKANSDDEEGQEYYEGLESVRFVRCVGTLGEHSKVRSIALEKDEQGRVTILRYYKIFPRH